MFMLMIKRAIFGAIGRRAWRWGKQRWDDRQAAAGRHGARTRR